MKQHDDHSSANSYARRGLVTTYNHADDTIPRKRIALVRPFSTKDAERMLETFRAWDDLIPCTVIDEEYDVDLVLSYSRRLDDDDSRVASQVVSAIKNKMKNVVDDGPTTHMTHWSECFDGLRIIEANIDVRLIHT